MKKHNQSGIGHIVLVLFIVAFAAIASFALVRTFAAKGGGTASTSPVYTYFSGVDSIDMSRSKGVTLAEDIIAGFGTARVAKVSAGGIVIYAGKGGGEPTFVKRCYLVKPLTETATIQIYGINNYHTLNLNRGSQGSYAYQEVCAGTSRKDAGSDKGLLNVQSGEINLYYTNTHMYF